MVETLPEALSSTAERRGELIFHLQDGPVQMSITELAERAQSAARKLAGRGIGRGSIVGILGPNRPEWAVWAWATWLAGAAVLPLQLSLRIRDPDFFTEGLRSLVSAVDCQLVLADPALLGLVPDGIGVPWDAGEEQGPADLDGPDPDDAAVIQFTSGSTSAPKGALIPHRAVLAQIDAIEWWSGAQIRERVMCGWVPFFHDLGLFMNVVTPVFLGVSCHYLPTERFAADPAAWLRLLSATGADWAHCPPSAFAASIRTAVRTGERIDLRHVKHMWLLAEPIDPHVADQAAAASEQFGLPPESLGAGYGLAEAVLGVTSSIVGKGLRFDAIDLAELAASQRAVPAKTGQARRVASCGCPAPGIELRIVRDGADAEEREIGEVYVRGQSMMARYLGANAADPFVDGWLRTGDLGYLADGELYITGRVKDVVIVMGHNYYPEDFEWAAGRASGVRAGRCVAFSADGDEGVVLLVEPRPDADPEALPAEVRDAVADAVGVAPRRVVLVPSGTVEKTSSGKLRRAAMKNAYVNGELTTVAAAR